MSYTYKGLYAGTPPGTIVQYLGTDEPDGWIRCDGGMKAASDGRFTALSVLLNALTTGNPNNSNSCTPPDLRERILYGKSESDVMGSKGGSSSKTLLPANIPSHTHGVNDPGHTHGGATGNHKHGFKGDPHSHTIQDGVDDKGHDHVIETASQTSQHGNGPTPCWSNYIDANTSHEYTGIWLYGRDSTGTIGNASARIYDGTTGITVDPKGLLTPDPFNIMPPYFVVNYLMKY